MIDLINGAEFIARHLFNLLHRKVHPKPLMELDTDRGGIIKKTRFHLLRVDRQVTESGKRKGGDDVCKQRMA